jgi:hypothetical protein
MSDVNQRNKGDNQTWEEIIPKGDLELVSLNTLIPRKTSKALTEATGWLQLTTTNLRYTKQATVQYLLERGLQSLYEDIERQDKENQREPEEPQSIVFVTESKMLDMIKGGKREYNMKEYESFANKTLGGYKYNR